MFCPASMCPLFAPTGSPWTGDFNAPCIGEECGFFYQGHCEGSVDAYSCVDEASSGVKPLQIGKVRPNDTMRVKARTFE